jgi:hypothetical protein
MQKIKPFEKWEKLYNVSKDVYSPFYNKQKHHITNLHPNWDYFDSETLFCKILFTDYSKRFTIIELIGEWNDSTQNDSMLFKRYVIDELLRFGINQYIIIGENVTKCQLTENLYFKEWHTDVEDGFIAFLNFREQVLKEFKRINAGGYFVSGGELDNLPWQSYSPVNLFEKVRNIVCQRKGD